MIVKICGLKKAVDVAAAVENGADMIGFVLRKVSAKSRWMRHMN